MFLWSTPIEHKESIHDINWDVHTRQLDDVFRTWEVVHKNQATLPFLQLINKAKPIYNHAWPIPVYILGKLLVHVLPAQFPKAYCVRLAPPVATSSQHHAGYDTFDA